MKKVFFIINSMYTYGGEQRVGVEIMNALCDDYEVGVIVGEAYSEKMPYELDKRIKRYHMPPSRRNNFTNILKGIIRRLNLYCGIFNNKYTTKLMKWAWNHKEYYNKIIDCINEEKPDGVIGLAGGYCVLLERISKECKIKTITWMHNSYEAYFETPRQYCWNKDYLFKDILPNIDSCIVLNEYIAKKYKENFGVDCEVIYNPRSFKSEEKADLSKRQFIASGRMAYAKGFDLLIEAFELFSRKNKDWNLVILGDGKERRNLERKIQKAGLEERVILTGFTDRVKEYMLDSSIFLLTSRWEGFPMVITEALEFGLPVIAFDITAMLPLVTDGEEGILVEPFHTGKFADAMLMLAEDKEKQRRMSENGIKKASQLSIENIVCQWKRLFERL